MLYVFLTGLATVSLLCEFEKEMESLASLVCRMVVVI